MQLRWVYKLQRPAKSIGSIAVGQEKQKSDLPCSWDIEPFRRGAGSRLMQNQQSLPLVQLLLLLVQLLLPLVHQHFPLIENSRHAAILWRILPSIVLLQPSHAPKSSTRMTRWRVRWATLSPAPLPREPTQTTEH